MRLELLCELEISYREAQADGRKFVLMRPFGGEDGLGYGEGDGTVNGTQLKGSLRFVNHSRRRSDGIMLPNMDGIITTDDGALVMFALEGRSVIEEGVARPLLMATFTSDDERYRWLNTMFCVLEGVIGESMTMKSRVYTCVNDLT